MVEFRPAVCPRCGGNLQIPTDIDKAICTYCGATFFVNIKKEEFEREKYFRDEKSRYLNSLKWERENKIREMNKKKILPRIVLLFGVLILLFGVIVVFTCFAPTTEDYSLRPLIICATITFSVGIIFVAIGINQLSKLKKQLTKTSSEVDEKIKKLEKELIGV